MAGIHRRVARPVAGAETSDDAGASEETGGGAGRKMPFVKMSRSTFPSMPGTSEDASYCQPAQAVQVSMSEGF